MPEAELLLLLPFLTTLLLAFRLKCGKHCFLVVVHLTLSCLLVRHIGNAYTLDLQRHIFVVKFHPIDQRMLSFCTSL